MDGVMAAGSPSEEVPPSETSDSSAEEIQAEQPHEEKPHEATVVVSDTPASDTPADDDGPLHEKLDEAGLPRHKKAVIIGETKKKRHRARKTFAMQ